MDWNPVLSTRSVWGQLIICEIVYGELAPAFGKEIDLHEALRKLGISFDSISPRTAWHAGTVFRAYREAGGLRQHLIADFLIAAHAQL